MLSDEFTTEDFMQELKKRYKGWDFAVGITENDGVAVIALSPERVASSWYTDWVPVIRLVGDDLDELRIALQLSISNKAYEGRISVPSGESFNPFSIKVVPMEKEQ